MKEFKEVLTSLPTSKEIEEKLKELPKQYYEALTGLDGKTKYDRRMEYRANDHFVDVFVAFKEKKNSLRKEYMSIYRYFYVFKKLVARQFFQAAYKVGEKIIKKCLKHQVYPPLYDVYQVKGYLLATRNEIHKSNECYELADMYMDYHRLESNITRDCVRLVDRDNRQEQMEYVRNKMINTYSKYFGKFESHTFDKYYFLIKIEMHSLVGNDEYAYKICTSALEYFENRIDEYVKLFTNLCIYYSQRIGKWEQSHYHIFDAFNLTDGKDAYWRRLGMYQTIAFINDDKIDSAIDSYQTYIRYYKKENDARKLTWKMIWAYIHVLSVAKGITHPKLNFKLLKLHFNKLKTTQPQRVHFKALEALYYYLQDGNMDLIDSLANVERNYVNVFKKSPEHHLKSFLMFIRNLPNKGYDDTKYIKNYDQIKQRQYDRKENIDIMSYYDLMEVIDGSK